MEIFMNLLQVLRYSATFLCEFVLATQRAVFPFLDRHLTSTPRSTRYLTHPRCPFLAAEWRGEYPVMSCLLISPPFCTNNLRISKCPLAAALCTAVVPVSSGSAGLCQGRNVIASIIN